MINKYQSLKKLGLSKLDKRRKVDDSIKKAIAEELASGSGKSLRYLANKYGVSVMTVRMIKDPKKEKETIKRSIDKRGKNKYNYKKSHEFYLDIKKRKEVALGLEDQI